MTIETETPKRRPFDRGGAAALALAAGAALIAVSVARAEPTVVEVPGEGAYPENIGASSDGALYVSSFVDGGIVRVAPGASKGEMWIKPGAFDTRATFGVLPDEKTGVLWVCSNDLSIFGIAGPNDVKGSHLKAFDLKTGEGKASYRLPAEKTICNDMTVAEDGSVYVTNTLTPHIYKLAPGAKELELWATDPAFDGGPTGAGLDGIAFGKDGNLYVNTFSKGELFRVDVKDGKPGKITRLRPSQPVVNADGLRLTDDGSFLMADGQNGAGSVVRVTVEGDNAKIETLKDGFTGGVTGVAQVGDVVWASVGQLNLVLDPAKKGQKPDLPFKAYAVKLPKR